MELLFRLIEWLVRSALEQNQRRNGPPVSASPTATSRPGAQLQQRLGGMSTARPSPYMPAQQAQQRSQPLVSSTRAASQDPLYDDGGWRSALTLLAVIALVILVIVWAVYVMQ